MLWTPVLWGLLTIVMVMGACAGSTSGGLKCIRMVILAKVSRNECKHLLHPQRSVAGAYKQTSNPPFHRIHRVGIFLSIFYHYHHQHTDNGWGWDSAEESIGCVVSSIGNMGPGLGDTGPAYSWNALPDAANGYCHSSCYWGVWNCSPSYFCSLRNSGNGIDLG